MTASLISFLLAAANGADTIANLILFVAAFQWARGYRWVKMTFSCGQLSMRAKDINASSLTNAISTKFFSGGQVSPEVRKEIILLINPKTR